MRRICCILLLTALTAPVAALAGDRASGDGSLVVTDANGTLIVQGKGLIFGHFAQGSLIVLEYKPDDPSSALTVSGGAKAKFARSGSTATGSDLRFLLPAGRYRIELIGTDIDVSAVGKGLVSATGAGTTNDGSFAVNGGKSQPFVKDSSGMQFGGGGKGS